uniref:carboxypeptidase M32 n=1 Tax=Candidatus Ventrimonas sp. TaxID=3048889 RepID=UPI003FEFE61B
MKKNQEETGQAPESAWDRLMLCLEKAMAYQTALTLFEWDNETLAPEQAGAYTARVQGVLAASYQEVLTGPELKGLISACEQESGTEENPEKQAVLREIKEEAEQLECIPPKEYRAYQELVAESARIWARAREEKNFQAFAPTLEKIIFWQKTFAGYRAKKGQRLYDVMLDSYEKGFGMKELDEFFGLLKKELVPLLHQVMESPVRISDEFLTGDYPEDRQRELAEYLAEYVGFDFRKGVLAESAHPFTTSLHNHDVRITTHYKNSLDSSLFSVIHESGHAIYEMGIEDRLTQTPAGQGASMGMHESQSRFFENILGRSEAFWIPVYGKVKELFGEQLRGIGREQFVRAINRVHPGLIRTEADELTYSLHVLVRYELEKALIEEDLPVEQLPRLWADKYEEYLGIRPENDGEGVLQDIHWAQGSFGYFPSYALGSAFGAQMYASMKKEMDADQMLEEGRLGEIREYLRLHVHRFGKVKTSRQILQDMTGEDFRPQYYVDYLKEKYGRLYQLDLGGTEKGSGE